MKLVKSKAEEYDCLFPLTGLLFSASTGNCEWASQVGFTTNIAVKITNITTLTSAMTNLYIAVIPFSLLEWWTTQRGNDRYKDHLDGQLGKPTRKKSAVFLNIVQKLCCKFGVFWRSFNNMKFAWKGTFEALMVKFEGKIGTLYQIFTPCKNTF